MHSTEFASLVSICSEMQEFEDSIAYLAKSFEPIIRPGESVLICFPRKKNTDFGSMAEVAVRRNGGVPLFWENDLRWKELLRLAFVSKASTVIAPPLLVLGLSKLAAVKNVPLYFYNVVLAGYPCLDWMMDGIEKGLDCKLWGVFGPGADAVLSGFSCECGRGIHIREDKFGIEILDANGSEVPDGEYGRVSIFHRSKPDNRFVAKAFGTIMPRRCPCGNPAPKLIGVDVGEYSATSLLKIAEDLLYWNSILDCRLARTEFGLEMELVCFKGEKLPKLPSCAKLIVRAYDPDTEVPIFLNADWTTP